MNCKSYCINFSNMKPTISVIKISHMFETIWRLIGHTLNSSIFNLKHVHMPEVLLHVGGSVADFRYCMLILQTNRCINVSVNVPSRASHLQILFERRSLIALTACHSRSTVTRISAMIISLHPLSNLNT